MSSEGATAVTIGNFDGVHLGHAALVRRCRELAGGGPVRVLSFDPHPMTLLRPQSAPARLSGFEQREAWLRGLGADEVVRLTPDESLLNKSAREFVVWLVERYRPRFVVEGDDFHFGKGRLGNNDTLRALGGELGFEVDVVPPVEVALGDDLIVRASSSIVRWLITQGRVADAGRVLGRAYEVAGVVRQGDQRGRTIGYPTANLSTEQLLPADGVYAAYAVLPNARRYACAVNVGTRPTFEGVERRLEAYVLEAPASGLEGYNWRLRVQLVAWVREDLKFDDVPSLVRQIERDCARVRDLLAVHERRTVVRPHSFLMCGMGSNNTPQGTTA
ncbi:MAG TPA: bifunctional riboflavin kinase/FMN adenylyltransferase [Phycisphaerales bacterium]|nr:bifunctional riboflavin kinase/FMN adenylyltransferase [Phycisphaerales bacterium]